MLQLTSNHGRFSDQSPKNIEHLQEGRGEAAPIYSASASDNATVTPNTLDIADQNVETARKQLLFAFSGQGSSADLLRGAFEANSVFASTLDDVCDRAISEHGVDLRKELNLDGEENSKTRPPLSQPAIFAIQVALTEAWAACGVTPDTVVGHSFGEFAAAVSAGSLSWEEGLSIVVAREALMSALSDTGGMIAVFQSRADVVKTIEKSHLGLVVACINAPNVTVVSGKVSEVRKAEKILTNIGVGFRRLASTQAFHSPEMRPMVKEFGRKVQGILNMRDATLGDDRSKPNMISTMTAEVVTLSELRSAQYWMAHVEAPVNFLGAMKELHDAHATVVEIGPSPILIGLMKRCLTGQSAPVVLIASLGTPEAGSKTTSFAQAVEQVFMSPWHLAKQPDAVPGKACSNHENRLSMSSPSSILDNAATPSADTAAVALPALDASKSQSQPGLRRRHSTALTILEAAEKTVERLGDQVYQRWLDNKGAEAQSISYRGLWERAGAVAEKLLGEYGCVPGDCVLICYSPGIECMVGFWGCLRAGVIAVPVYPPNPAKMAKALRKLELVRAACGAKLCLMDQPVARLRMLSRLTQSWPVMTYHNTEGLRPQPGAAAFESPEIGPEHVAYLQFTSGSTGDPKGVTLLHRNLWHNVNEVILPLQVEKYQKLDFDFATKQMMLVFWVPQYHDLGLVIMQMASFVWGHPVVGMSPLTFLSNPLLWLQAISTYKGTCTAAPNFAYGLVAKRLRALPDDKLKSLKLDLSSLLLLGDGGERVRMENVNEFATAVRPFGFRGVHVPTYGIAEHVITVSESFDGTGFLHTAKAPRDHLVAVGSVAESVPQIRIVDPHSRREVTLGSPGEIWVQSASVASGYWGCPELSNEVFRAKMEGESDAAFLRTGDEGFIEDGHLYICGRIKDMIILRGRNYYPDDVEDAVIAAAPHVVRPNCIAAFSFDSADGEQLGIVFEVKEGQEGGLDKAFQAIDTGVLGTVDIRPSTIVAIKAKTIPKTTSGKIQRRATKKALFEGALDRSVLHKIPVNFGMATCGQDDSDFTTLLQYVSLLWSLILRFWASIASVCKSGPGRLPCALPVEVTGSARAQQGCVGQSPDPPLDQAQDISESWISELRAMSPEARISAIGSKIRAGIERVAGVTDFRDDQPWGDAGLDSMSMMELYNALQNELGEALQLSPTSLFDYPCLKDLVDHIVDSILPSAGAELSISYRAVQVEPLAIVGMACRYPGGCNSADELWTFLKKRGNGVSEIPLTRMDWRKWYDPSGQGTGKSYTNRGAFVHGIHLFDSHRFGISASEASAMDPQQRIALEVAHEAMVQSGLFATDAPVTGLFVGECGSDFSSFLDHSAVGPFTASGAASSICANRISHSFGLTGPSMTIDTACSSSLVAVDAACKAIHSNDCSAAVVVGVNLNLTMSKFAAFCAPRMLSPNGRCATFSDEADGYGRGEGCGAIVLKPLSMAIEDGDPVWGVVHGSAVNQDGRTATLTAPNGPAQQNVIKTAMARAQIVPADVVYVEAHGTGTPLGDPQEVGALAEVFRDREDPLVVGALKSNIGHLEGAAGLAGLIKVVQCLRYQFVPPNINCERLNPRLEQVVGQCPIQFPNKDGAELQGAYAGVSSFGFGGTNAHVVLGCAPELLVTPETPTVAWNRLPYPWQTCPHPLLGPIANKLQGTVIEWTSVWDESTVDYLSGYRVYDQPSVPVSCYLEMVAPAVEQAFGDVAYELNSVRLTSVQFLRVGEQPSMRITFETQKLSGEGIAVKIESRSSPESEWIQHCAMELIVLGDVAELVETRTPKARKSDDGVFQVHGEGVFQIHGAKGDFNAPVTVAHGQNELRGTLNLQTSSNLIRPAFLQKIAWMEVSMHVGLEENCDEGERKRVFRAPAIDSVRFEKPSRQIQSVDSQYLHVHSQKTDLATDGSDSAVYDQEGMCLVSWKGLRLLETVVEPSVSAYTFSCDTWQPCQHPDLDPTTEILQPASVVDLHSAVLQRIDTFSPLCVVAADEELAAYLRSVRAEFPQWQISCVVTENDLQCAPAWSEEGEWAWTDGQWYVRRLQWCETPALHPTEPHSSLLDPHGVILVSGGLGYLGRLVVAALVEQGAEQVVLLSSTRSELPEDWDLAVRPRVVRCDVSDAGAVCEVFGQYSNIRGIIHAAGTLSDAIVRHLTSEDFDRVYQPKVMGAQNLHECSKGLELDFFVMFSSIASGLGAGGQANYAAANGCLDSLAMERANLGLPALSIRWGAWTGGGMATEATLRRLQLVGVLPLVPHEGVSALQRLICHGQPAAVVTVCPMDPRKLPLVPFFDGVRSEQTTVGQDTAGSIFVETLHAMDGEQRFQAIKDMIRATALRSAGIERLNDRQPWFDAGLDSLSMMELRNAMQTTVGCSVALSPSVILDYPCLEDLANYVQSSLFPRVNENNLVSQSVVEEPMAIVGMACRFPGGCDSPHRLWELLQTGGNAVGEIPLSRMDWRKWCLGEAADGVSGSCYTHHGAFIQGATMFDNQVFGITAMEAQAMDPQHRIALEASYEAMVQSGVLPGEAGLPLGVFATAGSTDFVATRASEGTISAFAGTGACPAITSNRISHVFGLKGPSMTIDTACSSSLVALDAACKAICNKDCKMAVVVGVQLNMSMITYASCCAAGMLSRKGRCATFSDEADGYARGEGCGAVVIQPLSSAQAEGGQILGVVHATAVNQDGRTATLTAPNGPAQEEAIRTALLRANILPEDVSFVEAHGTGTPLGDPQEIQALANVFGGRERPLVVGAVKSNIGHLESAAGMAGLIKGVLCLQHQRVPANINCRQLNPLIQAVSAECEFVFPSTTSSLDGKYVGVSSFGFGGTNAHVVLGSGPPGMGAPQQPQIEWKRASFPWKRETHPLLGVCQHQGSASVWTGAWDNETIEALSDGTDLVPSTAWMLMVAAAVDEKFGTAFEAQDARFAPLRFSAANDGQPLRLTLSPKGDIADQRLHLDVTIDLEDGVDWRTHASMTIVLCETCGKDNNNFQDVFDGTNTVEAPDLSEGCQALMSMRQAANEVLVQHKVEPNSAGTPKYPSSLRACVWQLDALKQGLKTLLPSANLDTATPSQFAVCRMQTMTATPDSVWIHARETPNGTYNVGIYGDAGEFLLYCENIQMSLHNVVSCDTWQPCQHPDLDPTTEILRHASVVDLHSAVLQRIDTFSPLCVVAADEELAAYLRSVRAEFPQWQISCVVTENDLQCAPAWSEEGEWAWTDGQWYVRRLQWCETPALHPTEPHSSLLDPHGVILVSGGLGYLGRLVVAALVEQGAEQVVLLSSTRSELPEDWDLAVRPRVVRCDVSDAGAVCEVFGQYSNIRGIIHAAGIASDKHLADVEHQDFDRVYQPKVMGAQNLHECSKGLELDFFVMFSSIASGLGVAPANYAAANGCLDALAVERANLGLPALSIRWGAWTGGGMGVAANNEVLQAVGLLPLSPSLGIQTLISLMRDSPPLSVMTVCPIDASRLPPTPYFSTARGQCDSSPSNADTVEISSWEERLRNLDASARKAELKAKVLEALECSGLSSEKFDGSQSWREFDLDSLQMLETRNHLQKAFHGSLILPQSVLFDFPCPDDLVDHIEASLFPQDGSLRCLTMTETVVDASDYEEWLDVLTPKPDPEEDLLVCLRRGNPSNAAIVFIYGGMGLAVGSQMCRYLDNSQPIYATQAPEYSDCPHRFTCLVERARDHADVLCTKFAATGVHLVGFSFGGRLSLEIGQRMREMDFPCSLTLIDPVPFLCPTATECPLELRAVAFKALSEIGAPHLDLYEQHKEDILRRVGDDRALDREISRIAQTEKEARLVKRLSRVTASLSREYQDSVPEASRDAFPAATIFVQSNGLLQGDAYQEYRGAGDGLFGWETAVANLQCIPTRGEHHHFFSDDTNMSALARHLQSLCSFELVELTNRSEHEAVVTLLDAESAHWCKLASTTTITFFKGDISVGAAQIRSRLQAVLDANPWVCGRVTRRRGSKSLQLVYPSGPIEPTVVEEMLSVSPPDLLIHSNMRYEQLSQRVGSSSAQLKIGSEQINRAERVLRVTLTADGAEGFALIASLSHTVADGYTYYALLNMLSSGQPVRALDPRRDPAVTHKLIAVAGRDYARLTKQGFVEFDDSLLVRTSKAFAFSVDRAAVEERKLQSADEGTAPFISTNDILTSCAAELFHVRHLSMSVNMRTRVPACSETAAGNYEALVIFDAADLAPADVRSVLSAQPFDLSGRPGLPKVNKASDLGLITNWASFGEPPCLDGCTQTLHLPVYGLFGQPETCVVFRPRSGELATLFLSQHLEDRDFSAARMPFGASVAPALFCESE